MLKHLEDESLDFLNLRNQDIEKLNSLNIFNLKDLLFFFPRKYENRSNISLISKAKVDEVSTFEALITSSSLNPSNKILSLIVEDDSSKASLKLFNASKKLSYFLSIGKTLRFTGKVSITTFGREFTHPSYSVVNKEKDKNYFIDNSFTPIYKKIAGLNQLYLRSLIRLGFEKAKTLNMDGEYDLIKGYNFIDTLYCFHYPEVFCNLTDLYEFKYNFQQNLLKEEALAYKISFEKIKAYKDPLKALSFKETKTSKELINNFLKKLPFKLTSDQKKACDAIYHDLSMNKPMSRLLQGDVGSGKTIVAALSTIKVIASLRQVAFMVPTEILAEQHYNSFKKWFDTLGVNICLLTRVSKSENKGILADIKDGKVSIVIGTHALFQKDVIFNKLALIIIDEQHRFGVHQRFLLKEKGVNGSIHPHQLVMTATPIPRSLSMILYKSMEHSIIAELPPNRALNPIKTSVMSDSNRAQIIKKLESFIKINKTQAYWVCPLIDSEESDDADDEFKKAVNVFEIELLFKESSSLRVGIIHGKMRSQEKQSVMNEFKVGNIDVLIATTVIEVGIDVANANMIIIENSNNFGLSQLHQLRGRVGRGSVSSFCILLYSGNQTEVGFKRLNILKENLNGFIIAEKDMELRGPGNMLGVEQAGYNDFKILSLPRDYKILRDISIDSYRLTKELKDALMLRWIDSGLDYIKV
ncbi:MAG: ATP-dependent DNA helicase RecG [Psittacicella sp.]